MMTTKELKHEALHQAYTLTPLSANVQNVVRYVKGGHTTAGKIAALCEIRPTSVSNDLAHARRLGLLVCRKVGRELEHKLTETAERSRWVDSGPTEATPWTN